MIITLLYNNNIQLDDNQINFKFRFASFYDYKHNIQKLEFNNYSTNSLTNISKNNIFINNNIKENMKFNNDNNIRKEICNKNIKYKNNSLINMHNKTITEKKNVFNVIHIKNKKKYKKNDKNFSEYNNEIKMLKNHKIVYANKSLLNSYSTAKNIKEFNKKIFIKKSKRSSIYRGVSKNGNQWQVLMMINKNKSYIGSYPSEETAARIYDILALKIKGFKARTNFKYNYNEIIKICETQIDIKAKNIDEIISKIFV